MTGDSHYFIGFPVPEVKRGILAKWQEALEPFVDYRTWMHIDDFHITIRFLGALSSQQVAELKRKLQSLELNAFDVSINGLNFFGKEEQPRVMYAEVERQDDIMTLKSEVDHVLETFDFDKEKRPYRPHITLAKKWGKGKIHLSQEALEHKIDAEKHLHFTMNSFNLYRVHPDQWPKYEVVQSFKLE
ncbi:RNA 2',3'-cyclic phosphodiesterase [Tenuibacillus multivorans]|nr:RNA 2',3'-cyclic phosphodiesterase [Tenuibacillus multivorans]GEL77211.1 RNA 2',3'-cyclic phosphodiesterase [Tenuibacillus multivorans]